MKIPKEIANELFAKANVNMIVIKKGKIVIGVSKKLPLNKLTNKDVLPKKIMDMESDVVETGNIKALKLRTDKWRPAPGGVSIGHYQITAGTLGVVVNKDGLKILSNNHVLANSNEATIGNSIWQPGPHDGGNSSDIIGTLSNFIPISWKNPNFVDCALAKPQNENDLLKNILEIGIPDEFGQAVVGDQVQKSGRTSGLTEGEVTAIDGWVKVQYDEGKIAIFSEQIITTHMLDGGDSGSVLTKKELGPESSCPTTQFSAKALNKIYSLLGLKSRFRTFALDTEIIQIVGLGFAGSDTISIHNDIMKVKEMLDFELS